MLAHWIWFAQLQGVSPQHKLGVLQLYPDPETIFLQRGMVLREYLSPQALLECPAQLKKAMSVVDACRKLGIRIITCSDGDYPRQLRYIEKPPIVLYSKGIVPQWDAQPVVGVVGTREASGYGLRMARQFGRDLSACGALVVSGGAAGVDTQAMWGALDTGSPTVAVLGCGVDTVYPASNRELFEKVLKNGCLLSEYPPNTRGYRGNFLQRNRIISAISQAVLVVEAPHRSGALSTARHAMEQGKELFAVPGNVDNPYSVGSNELLQDGARPALCAWDILQDYQSQFPGVVEKRQPTEAPAVAPGFDKKEIDTAAKQNYTEPRTNLTALTEEERQIVAQLTHQAQLVDDVLAKVDLPASQALSLITMLALKGVVESHPGGQISLNTQNS